MTGTPAADGPLPGSSAALRTGRARHRRPPSRRERAGAALVAAGLLAAAAGVAGLVITSLHADSSRLPPVHHVAAPGGPAATAPAASGKHGVARPVLLVVPAIGVSTRLDRIGLTSSGGVEAPASPEVAGWLTGSPRPGGVGSSIIDGHLDSRVGAGVFARLGRMHPGQRIYVIRGDHTVAVFRVTAVRRYSRAAFPSARVYGPAADAELRLITCAGPFDRTTRTYLDAVVVYASLIA
jgi:sortase family protein